MFLIQCKETEQFVADVVGDIVVYKRHWTRGLCFDTVKQAEEFLENNKFYKRAFEIVEY